MSGGGWWRWLGALILKPKLNATGEIDLAVSFTKLQKLVSLILAVILFGFMLFLWIARTSVLDTGVVVDPIPPSMSRCLWVLLGVTSANMVAGAIAYRGKTS